MNKVLVVDDDATLAGIISEVFATANQSTIVATTSDEALRIIRDDAEISTILADYRLKGNRTGLDVLREAQATKAGLRCFLMSGDLQRITESVSGIEVLAKPLRMSDLLARVN